MRDILREYLEENELRVTNIVWNKEENEKFEKYYLSRIDYYKRVDRDIKLEKLLNEKES